jgi:hypothetical protein
VGDTYVPNNDRYHTGSDGERFFDYQYKSTTWDDFYESVLPAQPSQYFPSGGSLTTREVTTVPIDPRTGMPATQAALSTLTASGSAKAGTTQNSQNRSGLVTLSQGLGYSGGTTAAKTADRLVTPGLPAGSTTAKQAVPTLSGPKVVNQIGIEFRPPWNTLAPGETAMTAAQKAALTPVAIANSVAATGKISAAQVAAIQAQGLKSAASVAAAREKIAQQLGYDPFDMSPRSRAAAAAAPASSLTLSQATGRLGTQSTYIDDSGRPSVSGMEGLYSQAPRNDDGTFMYTTPHGPSDTEGGRSVWSSMVAPNDPTYF